MRRFYFHPQSRRGDTIFLSEEESRHVVKVLRLPVGSEVELLDGQGTVYRASIVATGGRQVEARIEAVVAQDPGVAKTVWVAQGILKGEKMDTVVQKCTELGVTRLSPFESSRCQGKADFGQNRKRHERWQRIGLAACKQCLRPRFMQIDAPMSLADFLQNTDAPLRLLFWEEEKNVHLQDISTLQEAQNVALMLGPEGGFSREEIDLARQFGWTTVSLGERILRAETATLTAVSIVQFLIGNL
ncbi:MAG: 16S rRNA (uracil(1498)-N(3))-methyltransferase [Pseudomonadota bacterium]